jgi:predicted secreted protein
MRANVSQFPDAAVPFVEMRRGAAVVCAAVVAAALVAAVAHATTIVKVGPRANGTSMRLHERDLLVVSLPGNATTGFAWRVRSVDRKVLELLSSKYVPRKSGGKVGTGGTYVFRFMAVAAGKTTLKLGYVQAGGTTAAKTYQLTITVKKPPLPQI